MPATEIESHLRRLIEEELPGLIEFRRDLHAHPELMYQEKRTSERVRQALEERGIEHRCGLAGGTGVLAFLDAGRLSVGRDNGENSSLAPEGSAIALRADMDALPITETTGLPYASTNSGVMHACGHDGHTTILLGAARVLKRFADRNGGLPRPVKFVFQPAEEGGGGGKKMVDEGVLREAVLGPAASRMFGLHCWPTLPLGEVATRVGPLLAAVDLFTVQVIGAGGHAATPHYTNDPIVATAAIINALQTIASRTVDPIDSIVMSVTRIRAGTAQNVIPGSAEFGGTMRTLLATTRDLGKERFYEICEQIAAAHRCRVEIDWRVSYPVTRNHPDAVKEFFPAAQAVVGAGRATVYPAPCMGGEDFSYYCNQIPSCFFLLGQQRSPGEPYPNVHTSDFDFNDDSIAIGVEVFLRLALGMTESADPAEAT